MNIPTVTKHRSASLGNRVSRAKMCSLQAIRWPPKSRIAEVVAAEKDGKIVAVFDLDPQASAAFWKDTREADTPAVVAIPLPASSTF
jgi:hypothetical protein